MMELNEKQEHLLKEILSGDWLKASVALRNYGIEHRDSEGNWLPAIDVLNNISNVWNKLLTKREEAMEECLAEKRNFKQIDYLVIIEDTYRILAEGGYPIDICPQHFFCCNGTNELCEGTSLPTTEDLCKRCWKQALEE